MTTGDTQNTKVGFLPGGDTLYVKSGGTLLFDSGATITGLPDMTVVGALSASTSVTTPALAITDTFKIDGVSQTLTYTVTHAAGATNSIDVTVTAVDAAGATIAAVGLIEFYVSADSTGAGLTNNSATGALTASTGVILTAFTAKKHVSASLAATGIAVFNLVDSAKPATQYFCVKTPSGRVVVSAASGTHWGA